MGKDGDFIPPEDGDFMQRGAQPKNQNARKHGGYARQARRQRSEGALDTAKTRQAAPREAREVLN